MKNRDITKTLLKVTDGLTGSAVNTILFLVYLFGTAPLAGSGSRGVNRAFDEAGQILEDINYQTIKRALNNLTQKKLVTRSRKRSTLELEITKDGLARINEMFPTYRTVRPWDGFIYLISYDVPSKNNSIRNRLRLYLQKMGCALLQESLFVTPYAPYGIIDTYMKQYRIEGSLLVSKLGKDGAIGEESLEELIARVYHLSELEKEYKTFIETYKNQAHPPLVSFSMDFFSIVKKDPQLPFELLPTNFLGTEAYELFSSYAARIKQRKV